MYSSITFLVASPHLKGEIFEKSVILLLEHDQKGSMGLIINSPTEQTVSQMLPSKPDQNNYAWIGGPVDPTLGWCLYHEPLELAGEVRIANGLYLTSSQKILQELITRNQNYMLVLGYSGWAAGQLADEARSGAWVWVEQDSPSLLWECKPEHRWHEALSRLGVNPNAISSRVASA